MKEKVCQTSKPGEHRLLRVEYINPFTKSTVKVFNDFLGMDIVSGKPELYKKSSVFKDITGVIGLAGDVTGSVVLSFSKSVALEMVYNLIMKKPTSIDEEVIDTVGEVLNIIVGNAKQDLEEYDILISLPNVIHGSDYDIAFPHNAPALCVPFRYGNKEFFLIVSMKEKRI